jgi:steroid 5-alpha reductase family enzyme
MIDLVAALAALAAMLLLALAGWVVSVLKKDVSIVDGLWSLMFLAGIVVYLGFLNSLTPRGTVVTALVAVWAIRLSAYIFWRNHGEPEDRRYRRIRERNSPGFAIKSVYIVFGLQAALAWFIALPLLVAITGGAPLGVLDVAATLLWLLGFSFEAVGDLQLARFRADPANKDRVLDSGLWRYTRHPNYFGEFCIWWGFYLFAVAAGGWWTVLSPALMSLLLLKVSGVGLLEQDMHRRRPGYVRYKRETNAFFPGPKRHPRNRETFDPR